MPDDTPNGLDLGLEILDRHARLDELAPVRAKLYGLNELAADEHRAMSTAPCSPSPISPAATGGARP
jgi:hypothetical protein